MIEPKEASAAKAKAAEEKTVVLIKPDGVKRGLIGEITSRIERRGLKIIALEMIWATKQQMKANYEKYGYDIKKELGTIDNLKIGKMIKEWLIDYMTSGPLVKMIVKGIHAVDMIRKLSGNTMPALSEMETIRGDFSVDSSAAANRNKRAVHNIVHASETMDKGRHNVLAFFSRAS